MTPSKTFTPVCCLVGSRFRTLMSDGQRWIRSERLDLTQSLILYIPSEPSAYRHNSMTRTNAKSSPARLLLPNTRITLWATQQVIRDSFGNVSTNWSFPLPRMISFSWQLFCLLILAISFSCTVWKSTGTHISRRDGDNKSINLFSLVKR